jgi:hypothetical protein
VIDTPEATHIHYRVVAEPVDQPPLAPADAQLKK